MFAIPMFMAGMTLGWPSPIMDYTKNGLVPTFLLSSKISVVVACIDIGNFIMAIPIGRLMDSHGRKFTVFMSAPLMFMGWLIILYCSTIWSLYIARLIQGAAVSIAWVVSPVYIGEIASAPIRGTLELLVQLGYALGLLFSYGTGWLLADYWKLATISSIVPVVAGILYFYIPESPYYLMYVNRPNEAAETLRKLRRNYTQQDLDLELMFIEKSLNENQGGRIKVLLTRDRKPLVIVLLLAVLQMACGTSVLEAYAASILSLTNVSPNGCAFILGIVTLIAVIPFAFTVDRCGRRPLLVVSCLGTAVCHIATYLFLIVNMDIGGITLLVTICGTVFFINIGLMPLLSVIQCEYFPSDTRALGGTALVLTVTLASTIMVVNYQLVDNFLGMSTNFILYAILSATGAVFCYIWVPETKCKTFFEIQQEFKVSGQIKRHNYEQI
ncbi:uncharacterized protein LOC126894867 isoform X2 [Daktulosphaira vitifoliae]|uniref:uncharacterized protein LOC126894867 isoform X2 n=1 Tax=Daktulosphaira vitifoliae TaxID=58002 RepID=UPI0021A9F7C6|nr:uncharacterized protein LOC126894867 isoform X2 [Daktulosphaira vitifoliae]